METMDAREKRGLRIAETRSIRKTKKGWAVPSQSGRPAYTVTIDEHEEYACNCPDHQVNRAKCKHIWAVISREVTVPKLKPDDTVVRRRGTYRQEHDWRLYNEAQQKEKGLFLHLLHELCAGIEQPKQPIGRRRVPLRDVVFAAVLKVYLTFSGRRSATDIWDAQEKGHVDTAAHYNTMFRYFQTPEVTAKLSKMVTQTSLPLAHIETEFAVDSTGLSTSQYYSWFNKRYKHEQDNHTWLKMHFLCGTRTHTIVSAVATLRDGEGTGDSSLFGALMDAMPDDFNILALSADKAYTSREHLQTVNLRGGVPYIPFKTNAEVHEDDDAIWKKMYHTYALNRREFLEHYHRRSNAESVVSMLKRVFSGRLRSRSYVSQVNEVLAKVVCHNICVLIHSIFEFGLEPTFWK